jgi:hypothetical protein
MTGTAETKSPKKGTCQVGIERSSPEEVSSARVQHDLFGPVKKLTSSTRDFTLTTVLTDESHIRLLPRKRNRKSRIWNEDRVKGEIGSGGLPLF